MRYLIDSGIFFDYLKRNSRCRTVFDQRLIEGNQITLFCLIRYEVLRGYYKIIFRRRTDEAQKERERERIRAFEALASSLDGLSIITEEKIDRAAALYGETDASGLSGIPDIDLLLFTIARDEGYTIVSQDSIHLERLSSMYNIPFEDWTRAS